MTRTVVFAFVVIVCGLGLVGNMDYADALDRDSERKARAAARAKQADPLPARIWSKKCERAGKQIIATQADGGRWIVRCVNTNVKT